MGISGKTPFIFLQPGKLVHKDFGLGGGGVLMPLGVV